MLHPSALPESELLKHCTVRRTKRSGPGGQHRNKVETAVVIKHQPTGISAEASERRSQEQNRRVAVFRLRVNLALEVRIETSADAPASALWQSRCRGGKLSVSAEHGDFPALLAEAVDRVHAIQWDVKAAAESLGLSPSQLIKFLRSEPRALALVNAERVRREMPALK